MWEWLPNPGALLLIAHVVIVIGVALRVVMLRGAPGTALAWLFLVTAIPFAGLALYLSIGERRIGRRRARRMMELRADLRELAQTYLPPRMTDVDWDAHPPASFAMNRLATNLVGIPTVADSDLVLHSDTQAMLRAIASDIDCARHSVLIEFYIWAAGGTADEVLEAVIRAASRGVKCLVLIDYLGARPWWKSPQPDQLRAAGAEVVCARPTGLLRGFFDRNDLRMHRKIVVIDGEAAWTGSMNMVDPRFFKQESNVGQWIDALVRVEGTAVLPLATVFVADWHMETGQAIREVIAKAHLHRVRAVGQADVQVVPSGPESRNDAILQMLLGIIQLARDELVMTTPYFIPDDSMLRALRGAAARGVSVKLIVPARIDSMMVRFASRSYYDDLMEVGAQVYLFNGGLLHTKSITADGQVALIGTVNLDMRSLWLNSEVSLFVYDADFTKRLRALQETYLADCDELDLEEWMSRSFGPRLVENTFRLVSPLL